MGLAGGCVGVLFVIYWLCLNCALWVLTLRFMGFESWVLDVGVLLFSGCVAALGLNGLGLIWIWGLELF